MPYDRLLDAVQRPRMRGAAGTLLISVNPDLKSDFGHFLNYEKRMNEVCAYAGVTHHCLSGRGFNTALPNFSALFDQDSGYYSLYRRNAKGREEEISRDLRRILLDWIEQNHVLERYDDVVLFIYQGSSSSAARLSCLEWPNKVRVVVNSFWDFLVPMPDGYDPNLSRLKLQSKVTLLSMSVSHRDLIVQRYGLQFPAIKNPPPLVSDQRYQDILRSSVARKAVRSCDRPRLLLPGLMTAGKGRGITEAFVLAAVREMPSYPLVVRDRKGELSEAIGGKVADKVRFAKGDFSDAEIIGLYQEADAALLPYGAEVFNFRTSGALVDCLMSGTIPIVFPDTWLADICRKYDLGIICRDESLDAMLEAVKSVPVALREQRGRLLDAALAYLEDNSWDGFIETLLEPGAETAAPAPAEIAVIDGTEAPVKLAARLLLCLHTAPAQCAELAEALTKALTASDIEAAQKAHCQRVLAFYHENVKQVA